MQASANPSYDLKLNINQNGNPFAPTRRNHPLEPDISSEQDFEDDTKNNDTIKNELNRTLEEIIKEVKSARLIGEIVDVEFKVPNKPAKSTLSRKKRDEQRAFYESEECMDNVVFAINRYADSMIGWSKARNVHKRYRDGYLATQEVDTEDLELKRATKQLKARKAFHKAKRDMIKSGCVKSTASASTSSAVSTFINIQPSAFKPIPQRPSSTPILKISALNVSNHEDGEISDDDVVEQPNKLAKFLSDMHAKVEKVLDGDGDVGMKQ